MTSTTPVLVCRFCGGRQTADEHDCTGCGARLERPRADTDTTARLLEMSTQMNRLLHHTVTVGRSKNRHLRNGVAVVSVCLALFGALSTYFSNLAATTPGIHAYPSAAAARSAVEERQRDIAYQLMVDEGIFTNTEDRGAANR